MKKQYGILIHGIIRCCNCAAIYSHSELLIMWYFDQTTELALTPFLLLTATVIEFETGFKVVKIITWQFLEILSELMKEKRQTTDQKRI